jgi:hypothetical protein
MSAPVDVLAGLRKLAADHRASSRPASAAEVDAIHDAVAELIAAAKSAREVLGTIYGKYQRKIGPYATQANSADWALHTALARIIGGAQ